MVAVAVLSTFAQGATVTVSTGQISWGGGGRCSSGATCTYQGEASTDGTTASYWGSAGPLTNGDWGCCGPDFRGTGLVHGPIAAGTVLAFRYQFSVDFPPGGTATWRVVASGNLGGLAFSTNTGYQTATEPDEFAGLLYYQVTNAIPGDGAFTLLIDLKFQAPTTSTLTATVPRGGTLVWTNPSSLPGDANGDCLVGI
ncbi:MAG TPA: hypothetical protein VG797_00910, partial [Phycisphaerales bacterium]|nr:hypothetical protein [Phycisphaerales bacterium]